MGITFDEVCENELLDNRVLEWIPRYCECGGEIEFTESLRQIYCSNPQCYYKVAARLESMAKAMKVDGWGESTCLEICKTLKLTSPYQAFLMDKAIRNGYTRNLKIAALDKKVDNLLNSPNRKAQIWEIVRYAGIPNIETTAYKIFGGYRTMADAYSDIEKGQVPFIAEKLGIKSSESSAMAVTIYNNLIRYKDELMFGETKFDVYVPEGQDLYIAITGGVYGYRNKSEFVSYLNTRYSGKINAILMNSVSQQVDVLVADGDTSSKKYKTAKSINQKYIDSLIGTGEVDIDDVGKRYEGELKKVGEKILVTESSDLLDILDEVCGSSI